MSRTVHIIKKQKPLSSAVKLTYCGTPGKRRVANPDLAPEGALCPDCVRKYHAEEARHAARQQRRVERGLDLPAAVVERRRFVSGPVHCAAMFSKLWVAQGQLALCACPDPVNVAEYRANVTCTECLVLMDEHEEEGLWAIPPKT